MLVYPIQLYPVNIIQMLIIFVCILSYVILRGQPRYQGLFLAFFINGCATLFNIAEQVGIISGETLISPLFALSIGPSIYLFIRLLVNLDPFLDRLHFLHLLPTLAAIPFIDEVNWILAIGAVSQLCYIFASLDILIRYKKAVEQNRSDTETFELKWLFSLLFLLFTVVLLEILRVNLQPFLSYDFRNSWYVIDQFIVLLLITGFTTGLVRQSEIFNELASYEKDVNSQTIDRDADAESLFYEIDALVKQSKLFEVSRLTLSDIAIKTGLTTKDISWAINNGGNVSFADYINQLRVEQVIIGIQHKQGKTLLQIALDAGFNSKSSFNSVFKKLKGCSPSQYIKSLES